MCSRITSALSRESDFVHTHEARNFKSENGVGFPRTRTKAEAEPSSNLKPFEFARHTHGYHRYTAHAAAEVGSQPKVERYLER